MKSTGQKYDVIIIGAGPAGSSAARQLAQSGLRVLVAEQRHSIGSHIQCAEFVPHIISRYTALRAVDVAQAIPGIKTYINGELVDILRAPGYILQRTLWDKQLITAAAQAGAEVMTGVRAVAVDGLAVTLATGSEKLIVTGKFVLGCDGPRSLISKQLGNAPAETCVALQQEMLLVKPLEYARIYFDPAYYGGYAWVFPKGKTVNVGLAVHDSYKGQLKKVLDWFSQQLSTLQVVQDKTVLTTTGGLIPMSGLVQCLAAKQLLVAGDAAGCTHPVTGAGILNAVISGQLAAAAISQQGSGTDTRVAENYSLAIMEEYGTQLQKARDRLIMRNRGWTDNKQEFVELIRRSWVAFPEYYRQCNSRPINKAAVTDCCG